MQRMAAHLEQPLAESEQYELCSKQQRCKNTRKLPDALLNRLLPVFSQSALFDPAGKFKMEFDAWHESYVTQLNQGECSIKRGKGYYDRRFTANRRAFWGEYHTIKSWFDQMIVLLTKADDEIKLKT